MDDAPDAKIAVSRVKALTRAMLWGVPGCFLAAAAWLVYERLDFTAPVLANRLVEYCIALAALPLAAASVVCLVGGLRRLLLAVWPAPLGIFAGNNELVMRLGPMGTKRFGADRLEIRYPFELDDDEGGTFEAFLPEDQQVAAYLPRMRHPNARTPVHLLILAFAGETEREVVEKLRPAIDRWRASDRPAKKTEDE